VEARIMQLGRTIVGAIIGAAIGIAVMVAVYLAFGLDTVWLALPVAILTGLGVRTMVATGGHASYLRGAVTGALALGAYLFGWNVVANFAQHRASAAAEATRFEQPADAGDKTDEDAKADEEKAEVEKAEPPKTAPIRPRPRPASGSMNRANAPTSLSTLDFIVLCISALIAYELGRGTAPKVMVTAGEETPPSSDVPQGTHPDA
jgi:hypothetical protein